MLIEKELQAIGLSDKEAKVYLAALELGQDSVQNIANKSKVNRATTYSILENLKIKGLISIVEEGKKTNYSAIAPDYLSNQLELEQKKLEEMQKRLKKILPELASLHSRKKNKPTIKYFEGKQGILSCIEEFSAGLNESDEVARMVYNRDKLNKVFTFEEIEHYAKIRLGKKIRTKVIYNASPENVLHGRLGTRVLVSENNYSFEDDIAVHGDYIRLTNLSQPLSAILIKDKSLANTMKVIFDMAFETALRNRVDDIKNNKED